MLMTPRATGYRGHDGDAIGGARSSAGAWVGSATYGCQKRTWRMTDGQTPDREQGVAPTAGLDGDQPTGAASGPDGNLKVLFLKSGNIKRVVNPTAPLKLVLNFCGNQTASEASNLCSRHTRTMNPGRKRKVTYVEKKKFGGFYCLFNGA